MEAVVTAAGVGLLVAGVMFAFWVRKRRFDRTNEAGIERFPSYRGKVASRLFEACLSGASLILGVTGLLVLAFQYQDSWGWIVLVPFLAWVLFMVI